MTMTVTADWPGGLACVLAVRVVTGAATVQDGETATGAGVPPEQAITPSTDGSWVYGLAFIYPGDSELPVALAGTTFSVSGEGASAASYGAFRSASTMTAGTPVTLGASAPDGEYNVLALAEVVPAAGQSLAEDPSTPPGIAVGTGSSLTTAAFTPPPGALLVAVAVGLEDALILNDTAGLEWSPLVTDSDSGIYAARIAAHGGAGASTVPALIAAELI